jgi:hypothetical protein
MASLVCKQSTPLADVLVFDESALGACDLPFCESHVCSFTRCHRCLKGLCACDFVKNLSFREYEEKLGVEVVSRCPFCKMERVMLDESHTLRGVYKCALGAPYDLHQILLNTPQKTVYKNLEFYSLMLMAEQEDYYNNKDTWQLEGFDQGHLIMRIESNTHFRTDYYHVHFNLARKHGTEGD